MNNIQQTLPDRQVALVIIANHHFYTEIINLSPSKKRVRDVILLSKRFKFNSFSFGGSLGDFVQSFRFKAHDGKPESNNIHGLSKNKMNNDYYPMYFRNHKYANTGISGMEIQENDIIEFLFYIINKHNYTENIIKCKSNDLVSCLSNRKAGKFI